MGWAAAAAVCPLRRGGAGLVGRLPA